ncbi:MAG: hypothetical protein A2073_03180 [Deltaproteobacteria bacterium GWC2_42_11]|nr:MAG: hypothetical protein A2073_03180 [Deltaproteobacteria bacterium GWC2_42_11]HBO84225.1 twin-arginine translocase TatA/TatE family subunit [Deltaproteobacteria bacterium]
MFGLGMPELIIILVIILIIFGVGKLPQIGAGLGQAIKSFKKATNETEIDVTPQKEEKEKQELESSVKTESAAKSEKQRV